MVFRPLPEGVVTHRAYWGLSVIRYNQLSDELAARGFQQVFREVLFPIIGGQDPKIQTVWVLKAKR